MTTTWEKLIEALMPSYERPVLSGKERRELNQSEPQSIPGTFGLLDTTPTEEQKKRGGELRTKKQGLTAQRQLKEDLKKADKVKKESEAAAAAKTSTPHDLALAMLSNHGTPSGFPVIEALPALLGLMNGPLSPAEERGPLAGAGAEPARIAPVPPQVQPQPTQPTLPQPKPSVEVPNQLLAAGQQADAQAAENAALASGGQSGLLEALFGPDPAYWQRNQNNRFLDPEELLRAGVTPGPMAGRMRRVP